MAHPKSGLFERSDSLPTRLAAHLRGEIVAGRLKPGDRLVEQNIAESCGVSRVPLREALRILATEGLITIAPHRGASVNLLSVEELVELFAARAAIEGHAAMNAAKNRPRHEISAMRKTLEGMRTAISEGDLTAYYSLAADFHRELIVAGGNRIMIRLYEQIRHQISRYQAAMSRVPELPSRSNLEHARILRAVERGDGPAAREAAESHINALVRQFRQSANVDQPAATKRERMRP